MEINIKPTSLLYWTKGIIIKGVLFQKHSEFDLERDMRVKVVAQPSHQV